MTLTLLLYKNQPTGEDKVDESRASQWLDPAGEPEIKIAKDEVPAEKPWKMCVTKKPMHGF